ncbi:MAG: EAL domain-containing protein [Chloroflexi bacterium]|nr:EAL domain-containing protein [Chloroflexota bacterium]
MNRVDRERAFVVLRSAQRALLRAEDEAELLDSICRIAVDEAGYRLAWVGLAEDDPERTVRPVAQAGAEAGYLGSITITWADTPLGHGPTGSAIRTGRPVIGRNFLTDPELAPWREQAISHGFASSLALPLRADDGPFGVLTIYATTLNAFTADDVELLSGLADDLAFGITMLRTRAARGAAEEGLRRSERSLAEAQRIAHIGSWEWDFASDAVRWSDEHCRIYGLEPGTFGGTNEALHAFVHPEDRAGMDAADRRSREDGLPYSLTHRIIRPDGTVRLVHEDGEAIRDSSGRPVRMVGTVQDITERVQLEAQQTRLARLLDELASEIYVFDAGTLRFTGANAGALRNLGYSLDELRAMTPLELKTELTPASFADLLAPLRTGARDQVAFETLHCRKDGSTYPVEVRVHLLATEVPPVFVAVIEDITERIAAGAERTRLVSAIEQTADSIWMHDLDSIVTYVNGAFSRAYGYEPAEIVGRYAGIVDSGRHEPAFWSELWASVRAGRTWSGSIVNRRRDGTLFEVEAVISGIRDAAGQLIGYMQTDRDVTRERALESALARDARERQMIESALGRIDPADAPEAIAAAACAEIVGLPEIDSALVIGLGGDHGRILAVTGRMGLVLTAGTAIPDARAGYLRERAATGPWVEAWQARPEDGAYGVTITATGVHTAGYAPLKGPHGVVGVIGVGVHEAHNAERIIERLPALATFGAIVGALVAPGLAARHREDGARAAVQAILDAAAFSPFFQPIVEFHSGAVVGYEALSRFDNGTPPEAVFALAARAGLGIELETATLGAALEVAAVLPPGAYLSLNASPALIGSEALRALLAGSERGIVLEVTEHVGIDDYGALRHELAALGPSVRLAVDDAGAGYASLRHILELAPDFVKLDIGLIRGIDADPARQALIAGIGYFAVKGKVHLIAEGIETTAELRALRGLAIGYGQGYLLGRPQDGRAPGPWPTRIDLPSLAI